MQQTELFSPVFLLLVFTAVVIIAVTVVSATPKKVPKSLIQEKIDAGAMIVDVRSPEEFASKSFPNAINIPVDQISARIDEFGDKKGTIVVYCASGRRATTAASILKKAGYLHVINAGGLKDMPEQK